MITDRVLKRVWDAEDAFGKVASFVVNTSFAEFAASDLLQSAVERQLEIAGEALNVAAKLDPSSLAKLPELRDVVGLRNRLAHQYFDVDVEALWVVATEESPKLRLMLADLLPPLE